MRYSIVGLGKLGASMVAAIASRGLDVIGLDINTAAAEAVAAGLAPVHETDLEATLTAHLAHIRTTRDYRELVEASDVTFVIVPTPSDDTGRFSLAYLQSALEPLGQALRDKPDYHNVVITSTVLPGATRYGLLPVLEEASGKRGGPDFGLCYSPEFIALGSVIRDFLNPDLTLIGELDARAGDHLEAAYGEILANQPTVQRMSFENAELTKVSVNAFITTKITFANMLCQLCERIPGGNVDAVTEALGKDSRIGAKYLKGALGYGGPCFPRDNRALASFAEAMGLDAPVSMATDRANRAVAGRIVESLRARTGGRGPVGVLGLAYKPESHVVEASQGLDIVRHLVAAGMTVVAHDPLANESARAELSDTAVVVPTAEACVEASQAVVITTPDRAFSELPYELFARTAGSPRLVFDLWRLLKDTLAGRPGVEYVPYGCQQSGARDAARMRTLWQTP